MEADIALGIELVQAVGLQMKVVAGSGTALMFYGPQNWQEVEWLVRALGLGV